MPGTRTLCSLGLSAAVALSSLATASPATAGRRRGPCTDSKDRARRLEMVVDGETATGRFALPAKKPDTLVVFAHGYGHTSASWVEHMKDSAREHGVAAVTMDNRGIEVSPDSNGDGLPESRGWNVMKGAEDSIAAAQRFESRCRSIEEIVIFGVSMGGNTSGLAVALAGEQGIKDSEGKPLFDYWIDVEGAVNMTETYLAARAAGPANGTAANAREDIEKETGGTIEENPDAYERRTVVSRIDDVSAAGLKRVVVIHGLDDGLVPYNQAREMSTELFASQVPTDMMTISLKTEESERETTASGHLLSNLDPNYRSPLAGHASEKSKTHVVMVTAFRQLWSLLENPERDSIYTETLVSGNYRWPESN